MIYGPNEGEDPGLDDRLFWLLKNNNIDPLGDFAGDLKHLIQEYIGFSLYLKSDCEDGFEEFMHDRHFQIYDARRKEDEQLSEKGAGEG